MTRIVGTDVTVSLLYMGMSKTGAIANFWPEDRAPFDKMRRIRLYTSKIAFAVPDRIHTMTAVSMRYWMARSRGLT